MASAYTVASAPGKVLLAGGYLVLEQCFSGLVVGTSARFYTGIRAAKGDPHIIRVSSPQFDAASWAYSAQAVDEELVFASLPTESQNKFVETCLRFALMIIQQRIESEIFNKVMETGLDVSIVGDNDFYSQRPQLKAKQLPTTAEALASLPPFCHTQATLATVHKTGLGSSAALTTSLVAALFAHFKAVESLDYEDDRVLIHNVAQYVHCFAQGKVGSGFDVSAAVWGSHRYRRFNPAILSPIMKDDVDPSALLQALDAHNKEWDNLVAPFTLPCGLELMLADIDAGSHTPTLVSKVLAWRKAKADEAIALWDELGFFNDKVEEHFRDMEKAYAEDPATYEKALEICAQTKASQWNDQASSNAVVQKLANLAKDFGRVRSLLQTMSTLSDVPIEPAEQTRLLDACMKLEGVVMAGVPGAGGFDAIFCIVLSEKAKESVYKLWETWQELNVCPLLCEADSRGIQTVDTTSVPKLAKVFA
ncbi:Phosphomevalonate kinase [Radiomyces spectabilis]|uniref:Phosphomevalonate kinase n=1 Tax=Radiomyces spectabilis TaxID=64574 RepID=UPI0022203851|nr:Phosphomevalonate kinase [Radiomyces spectabilis]KAI8366113.1 Phosphomevalonate kinase [Radiomyces spectabilis]